MWLFYKVEKIVPEIKTLKREEIEWITLKIGNIWKMNGSFIINQKAKISCFPKLQEVTCQNIELLTRVIDIAM